MVKEFHYNYLTVIKTRKAKYYYVGKHSTDNLSDGYFGSGTVVKNICKKHPHKTRILKFFETEDEAYDAEVPLVEKAKLKYGKHSLNFADGGRGKKKGTKLSLLTKCKMSRSKKGVKWSDARIEASKHTTSNKGLNHYSNRIGFTDEHKAKIGLASKKLKGFKHSYATIKNMSDSKKGEKNPMFGKQGAMKGKPSPIRNEAWKYYDELKILWVESNKPSAYMFKKIALSRGYPNCSYRGIVSKWQV